jgi:hypothetical protein
MMSSGHDGEHDVRRHRFRVSAAVAAAVLVGAGIVVVVASHGDRASEQPTRGPALATPESSPTKSQGPETWTETRVTPVTKDCCGGQSDRDWIVADPSARDPRRWFDVIAGHLDPTGELLRRGHPSGATWVSGPREGDKGYLQFGLLIDDGVGPRNRCRVAVTGSQCHRSSFLGRSRGNAWVERSRHDVTYQDVTTVVERADGTLGYVQLSWGGEHSTNPFALEAMAEAAADPRLTLPAEAFAVPHGSAVAAVVGDHFDAFRPSPWGASRPGFGGASGHVRGRYLAVQVIPARRPPWCNRVGLLRCFARQVYGRGDPTTVYIGAWYTDFDQFWSFAYVGPRHTVLVHVYEKDYRVIRPLGSLPQKRLIDLLIDPRLQ